jgi:hypothetical protein
VWGGQHQYLGMALTEEETAASLLLHARYENLQALIERIRPSLEGDKEIRRLNARLWHQIETEVTAILDQGNPIQADD